MSGEKHPFEYIVRLENLQLNYGKVEALKNINFKVKKNEIVGLIGDNGAGKSSLIKVVTGVEKPTRGRLFVRDEEISFKGHCVKKVHGLGIETVYQTSSLGEKQSLWRNFFVGRQIKNRYGFIDVKKEKAIAQEMLLEKIGFRGVGITVDSPISELSGGERQGVAIGRAMYFDADLIILDEPTVALSLKEVAKVLDFVKGIKRSGRACIFIEHNMYHVYDVCDRFVILDRGETVNMFEKSEISLKQLNEYLLNLATDKPETQAIQ
jgi:simple sugar transport system ATP-binding protein